MENTQVREILKSLSLEEKARLVNGFSSFGTYWNEAKGIHRLQFLDGGTGLNFEQLFGDILDMERYGLGSTNGMTSANALINVNDYYYEPDRLNEEELALRSFLEKKLADRLGGRAYSPSCFPPGMLLGATFNPDVVGAVGNALGLEAALYGIHVLLGTPNVNIMRDPLNGRVFEGYSEDPYLVAQLAPALVKGVERHGVAANVKHFAANNQETNRVGINETISRRALQEIYLPGFRACVQAGVHTLMSAYNRINGLPCTENSWLLTDTLRKDWGFEGMVVSDWGAVYHDGQALSAGNDLAMPGPRDSQPVRKAVESGELQEEALDRACLRILSLMQWLKDNHQPVDMDLGDLKTYTDQAAYQAAAEGIVLLKNDGVLPLKKQARVLLTGSGKDRLLTCGSGSAGITTDRTSSLRDRLASNLTDGCVTVNPLDGDYDTVIVVARVPGMEGNDRPNMYLCQEDLAAIEQVSTDRKLIVILNTCGPVDLTFMEKRKVDALLFTSFPGMEGGNALGDILAGRINPSGKLPITFPKKYTDTPTCLNFPGDGYEVNYGEGIYVGYRYYDKKGIRPAYPFGFGLSYTSFAITDFSQNGNLEFTASIRNTGEVAGAEVLQIYVADPASTLPKPPKELKGFQKVYLEPGEEKVVTFRLDMESFQSFDSDLDRWTVEEGDYDIILATSADAADRKGCVRIYLDVDSPYRYGINSTIKVLWENRCLKDLCLKLWEENHWDVGILRSNYQYTSNRTLKEILPDQNADKLDDFLAAVRAVKKE